MSVVRAAITQVAWTGDKESMIARHEELAREAAAEGAQVIGFQELFYGPYFGIVQDQKYYAYVESIPGPTVERFQALAKELGLVMVLPIYEVANEGEYYNTAAVVDADGTLLGKYRKHHIPNLPQFWEKFYFRPGNLGYPVFDTAVGRVGVYICYDRHFPEGWRELGLNNAQIVFNPSATKPGLSNRLWEIEQPAAAAANQYFIARQQPDRPGDRRVRRRTRRTSTGRQLLRRPARQLRRRRRLARTRRRSSSATSTSTRSPRPATTGSSTATAARSPTPRSPRRRGAPMTTLIKGGTVVSSTGSSPQDVLIDGETIAAVLAPGSTALGVDPASAPTRVIDATGKYVIPGGIDGAHPHGDAVRRHLRLRHLRDRHAGRGVGRHDDDHRLRRAGPRAAGAGPGRALAREGRRQLRDRLRLPPDHRRGRRRVAQGDGRADRRGHHQLQAVHGLPGRVPVQRRADRAGDADRGRQRRPDHDARRERLGHRRARPAGARPRRDRALLPRRHPALADRAGGHPPRDHAGRPDRRAALRRARVGQAGAGPHRRGPQRRAERLRRDLPAVPLPVARGEPRRAPGLRGREVGLLDAAARRGPRGTRTSCGATSAPATSPRCPPTTARSA